MTKQDALCALCRFGMGAGPGEAASIAADPRGWLLSQWDRGHPEAAPSDLPSGTELARRSLEIRKKRRDDPDFAKGELRRVHVAEAAARTRLAAQGPAPLVERLVRFWSNHFTVSTKRAEIAPLVGAFEREAIRPHVRGRFLDMLRSVARHPAMLGYLDNARSIGPNSPVGRKQGKGLNENLAREMLELHTLGVSGGYGQEDVEALARILTGWTVDPDTGGFVFAANRHEPGAKTLLGRRFEGGEDEAEAAMAMLARHPSTARFIATKLARHFAADDPPPSLIQALERAFLDSDGDLSVVTRLLVGRPEAWAQPLVKLRTPDDLVVAVLKLIPDAWSRGDEADARLVQSLGLLGQPPWGASSPAGWEDRAEAWIGPDAMMTRLEWAQSLANRLGRMVSARDLASQVIHPGPATRDALAASTRPADALFVLLASREFQRR